MYFLIILFSFFSLFSKSDFKNEADKFKNSVVKIEVNSLKYSYEFPWLNPKIENLGGTGFIVELSNRKWILTNAHVVSNAYQILVRRQGSQNYYYAKVVHIAHDCDLALLDVDVNSNINIKENSREEFFKEATPLEIGEFPELNSPVLVIGFPIGGDKISITKGIVSRIEMDTYAHSGIDSHLVIQVDAAINPGNSGGPALQNGKVIGIAFQIYRSGENLGYLIPPVVIQKFFKDISLDNKYNGYIELGVLDQDIRNPMMKEILGLNEKYKDRGVYVYDILPGSSAEGYLKPGDIILSIQGYPITDNKEVYLNGEYRNYAEVIDNLEEGENIYLEILRDGKLLKVNFPAKISNFLDFQRKSYDEPPEYLITGSFLFQPLNYELMSTYSSIWLSKEKSDIIYSYYYAIQNRTGIDSQQVIVLTNILNKSLSNYIQNFEHSILQKVNGKKIINLEDLRKTMDYEVHNKEYIVMEFSGNPLPLIVKSKFILNESERIKNLYKIHRTFYFRKK